MRAGHRPVSPPDGDAVIGEGHLVAGRYRLVRRIGAGAMGVVWQGHDERLDRPVAVKKLLLRPGLRAAEAAEKVARCLREGRIAARLHHPNAISVFDVVDEDGVPNLVMEYMRSRSVATAIAEEGPLPPAEVAAVGAQVAAALAAAHAAGIVHRDITPANVLLGEDGSAKLTDFGISRAVDDGAVTKSGLVAGTPAYLAPEVALGGEPTPASDVFSLGSTLYAAVEGEPPFGLGPNVLGVLHAVACGEINPPRRSGPLTDVLLALLTTDPAARPTAAQARDLLAAVRPDEATELLAPPVVTEQVPAPVSRRRGPYAVAGVFVVALIAVGLWLLGVRTGVTPNDDRSPADKPEQRQTEQPANPAPVVPAAEEEQSGTGEQPAPGGAPVSGTAPETTAEQQDPATTTPPTAPTTTDQAEETTTAPPTTTTQGEGEEPSEMPEETEPAVD